MQECSSYLLICISCFVDNSDFLFSVNIINQMINDFGFFCIILHRTNLTLLLIYHDNRIIDCILSFIITVTILMSYNNIIKAIHFAYYLVQF